MAPSLPLAVAWRRTLLRFLLGIALVGVLGWWARDSLGTLRDADPLLLLAAVGCSVVAYACWFEAFYRAVGPVAPGAGRRALLPAYLGGSVARHVAPAGSFSGVAVSAFVAGRGTGTPGARTLGAVAVLEVLSVTASLLAALTGLSAGVAITGGRSTGLGDAGALVGAVLGATLLGVLLVVLRYEWLAGVALRAADLAQRGITWVRPSARRRFSREVLSAHLDRVLAAARTATGDRRATALTLAASYVGWLAVGTALYLVCRSLALPVAPWTAVLAVPVAGVAGVLPTPGGLGGVEALLVALLVATSGGPAGPYVAAAILFRVVAFWLHMAMGVLGTATLGGRRGSWRRGPRGSD